MERKQCADCGQSSLQDELCCWACGGSRFDTPGVHLAGEPTICLGEAREVTASWSRSREVPTAPLYVLCGAACALFTCMVGYWVGRASVPSAATRPAPEPAAAVQPVALPTPPTGLSIPAPGGLSPGVGSTGTVASAPPVYDPAVVTVHPKERKTAPRTSGADAAQPPQPTIFANPLVQPRRAPQVVTQPLNPAPSRATLPAAAPALPPQPAPAATASSSVVMLRNSANVAVEVSIEGPEQWTAVVAPGSAIPVTLMPGSYQLRASGDGARSRRSTLALAANRNYSLVVDRRREGDRDTLVLIEPAVDGQPD